MITIDAIGAPITDADSAAIPAKIKESPKEIIPNWLPVSVKIPPIAAPRTSAGENTPPKNPKPKHAIVTISLRKSIINRK